MDPTIMKFGSTVRKSRKCARGRTEHHWRLSGSGAFMVCGVCGSYYKVQE